MKRRHEAAIPAVLALVPLLLFADVLSGFNSLYVRDVARYYYPAKKILREIVLGGHFPYWNPYFSSGQPMAANPEHEVFYPLTWLILLPGYHFAFHLLALLHLSIAVVGMYALLRSLPVGRPAACFGALTFGAGGLLLSMLNLFPELFSAAWMPVTCLFGRRFLVGRSPRDLVLAAVALGMQLLIGEPATALLTGLALGLYALSARPALQRTALTAAIGIAGLLVAAVQVLPAIDHVGDSVRARGLPFDMVRMWSFPAIRAAEIFFPHIAGHVSPAGHQEYFAAALYPGQNLPFYASVYSGLAAAVLALGGVFTAVRGRWLFLTAAAVSLVLALGDHTPLLQVLYDTGAARSTRYFEKFVLLGVFAVVVFGAVVLDRLLAGDERVRRRVMAVAGIVTALAAAAALLTYTPAYEPLFRSVFDLQPHRAYEPLRALARTDWLLAVGRGALLLILVRNLARVRRPVWLALLALFTLLDVGMLMPEVAPRIDSAYYREVPEAAQQLPANRHEYRLFHYANWTFRGERAQKYHGGHGAVYWVLRNGLAPMMPATYGIRTAIDVDYDRTELLSTTDFTESIWELSRAAPQQWLDIAAAMSNAWFVGVYRDPDRELARVGGDLTRLQPVRFVEGLHHPRYYFASEVVPIRDRAEFVARLATGRFTRRAAFVEGAGFQPSHGAVRRWSEWPNGARLEVESAGRAFLVMSVTAHKYWRITIDGRETPAIRTNIGYQGVVVPQGRHVVEMRYRNPLVATGAAISVAALVIALGVVWASGLPRGGRARREARGPHYTA